MSRIVTALSLAKEEIGIEFGKTVDTEQPRVGVDFVAQQTDCA
jgi:hypothetical protein